MPYGINIRQVDYLTTTEGTVLAEAYVNIKWDAKLGDGYPIYLMRGWMVLSDSNGIPTATKFYTLPSNIPGVGIRLKDNHAAGQGHGNLPYPYLTKVISRVSYMTLGAADLKNISDQYKFELVLTDIEAFQGGTQGSNINCASFSVAIGSAVSWALLTSEGDKFALSQSQTKNHCFAYYDITTAYNSVTLNPPLNPTCEIRADSSFQMITMPALGTPQLPKLNAPSKDFETFSFALHKCRKGTAPYLSLKDLTDSTNTTTNLTISNNYGDRPDGLAIRLLRQLSDGTWKDVTLGPSPLTIDSSLPNQFAVGPVTVSNSVIEVPFRAHYVGIGKTSAGFVEAKAVIEGMYK